MTTSGSAPRELGFWMCTALVIGNTIGIGIFMMPAALAPYGLNSLIGWVITVLGCVAVAWVFAGFARIFPQDDGPYVYTQRAFGSPTAFMFTTSAEPGHPSGPAPRITRIVRSSMPSDGSLMRA